jgi:broad specificity phosphatase PhoE
MTVPRNRAAALLVGALLLAAGPLASELAAQDRTVILVRHAEKSAPEGDPPLSPAGEARAEALARTLAAARIEAVVATQYRRTQATAAPAAKAAGVTPVIVPTGRSVPVHADSVAAAVRRQRPGAAVLVVGHSNTIPTIVGALGGPALPPDLCDAEYATLFVLVVPDTGRARLVRASYGAPDPAGATSCYDAAAPR